MSLRLLRPSPRRLGCRTATWGCTEVRSGCTTRLLQLLRPGPRRLGCMQVRLGCTRATSDCKPGSSVNTWVRWVNSSGSSENMQVRLGCRPGSSANTRAR
jgi:hypothetical protein